MKRKEHNGTQPNPAGTVNRGRSGGKPLDSSPKHTGIISKPEMNLGEVLDRLSILTMKVYFGDEQSISEHRYLTLSLQAFGLDGKIIASALRLQLMNRMIWELENEMRRGSLDSNLEEMGKRAIKIRDFNAKRIEYKNEINHENGGFIEKKIQHRSQT